MKAKKLMALASHPKSLDILVRALIHPHALVARASLLFLKRILTRSEEARADVKNKLMTTLNSELAHQLKQALC